MKIYLAGPGIDTGLFDENNKFRYIYMDLLFSFYDLSDCCQIPFRKLSWQYFLENKE